MSQNDTDSERDEGVVAKFRGIGVVPCVIGDGGSSGEGFKDLGDGVGGMISEAPFDAMGRWWGEGRELMKGEEEDSILKGTLMSGVPPC